MKRLTAFLALSLAALLLISGWWFVRTSSRRAQDAQPGIGMTIPQAALIMEALGRDCSIEEEPTLLATGWIEGDDVSLVSELGGRIQRLEVAEGDEVRENEVLVQLNAATLEAGMAEAEAAVTAAQAHVDEVKAGTHPAEILAAEAWLLQAAAERDAAWQRWQDAAAILQERQEIMAQIAQAEAEVDVTEAAVEQARASVARAEVARDKYRAQGTMEEKYLYRVHNYQVEAANVALDAAKARNTGATETLAVLRAQQDNPLALINQVHLAEGQYQIAESGVGVAQANVARIKAGPTEEDIQLATARVAQAQAAVGALKAMLDKMTLRSPITGIVTSCEAHAGETVVPGARLLTVAGLDPVSVRIYIPERDLARVFLGQEIRVQVDSYPERSFSGHVVFVAQEAEFTPKNVQTEEGRLNMVFEVKVLMPNPEGLLKPGMPADAILRGD